jgi:hypothetical protein
MVISGDNSNGFSNAEDLVISWWIPNVGQYATNKVFEVEIRFDDVSVKRWTTNGLSRNWSVHVENADGTLSGTRPSAGTHVISLIIDPTNRVPEKIRQDNRLDLPVNFVEPTVLDTPENLLPNLEQSRARLQFLFGNRKDLETKHDMGWVLLWTKALTDTPTLKLSASLRANGTLTA